MQVLHFEHCICISLVFTLFQELTEWEIHFPTGGCCAVQKGSTFFGSFFPDGKKEHKQRQSAAVACGERRTFFLLIHRTSQPEVLSPIPYKGRLIGDAVCFEAVSYGKKRTF